MVRYRRASGQRVLTGLLMSERTRRDTLFGDELLAAEESKSGFSFALALTREPATRRSDFSRRIDAAMVADIAARLPLPAAFCVCVWVERFRQCSRRRCTRGWINAASIKTERYGA